MSAPKDLSINWDIAAGSVDLVRILNDLLDKIKQNPELTAKEYNILYQMGMQRSMLQVDATERPFIFRHYDLDARAATAPVKNAIKDFLWQHWAQDFSFSSADTEIDPPTKLFHSQFIDITGQQIKVKMLAAFAAGDLIDLNAISVANPVQAIVKIREYIAATNGHTQSMCSDDAGSVACEVTTGLRTRGLWSRVKANLHLESKANLHRQRENDQSNRGTKRK